MIIFTDWHAVEIIKKLHKINNNACQKENPVLPVSIKYSK